MTPVYHHQSPQQVSLQNNTKLASCKRQIKMLTNSTLHNACHKTITPQYRDYPIHLKAGMTTLLKHSLHNNLANNCTSSNTVQIQKILHNKSIESPMITVECKTGTTKHRVPKLFQKSK